VSVDEVGDNVGDRVGDGVGDVVWFVARLRFLSLSTRLLCPTLCSSLFFFYSSSCLSFLLVCVYVARLPMQI